MLDRAKPKTQNGDTIVEVLIVLAVLGFAISLAFATANRSLLNARQAQENSEATAFVQSQVEALRQMATINTPTQGIFSASRTTPFCIKDLNSPTPTIETTQANCDFGNIPYRVLVYSCDKQFPLAGTPCPATNTNDNSFAVQATWPDVFGAETDTVTITYRVHSLK